jgi:hypothetical protein
MTKPKNVGDVLDEDECGKENEEHREALIESAWARIADEWDPSEHNAKGAGGQSLHVQMATHTGKEKQGEHGQRERPNKPSRACAAGNRCCRDRRIH